MGENDKFIVEQKKDYKRFADWNSEYTRRIQDSGHLTVDAEKYNQWFTMHDNTIWFDTSACFRGSFFGDINKMTLVPQNYAGAATSWWSTSDHVQSHTWFNSEQMPTGERFGLDTRLATP